MEKDNIDVWNMLDGIGSGSWDTWDGGDYCGYCFERIQDSDQSYECPDCGLVFCSFKCKEEHECGVVRFPELKIPWENDEEIGETYE